MDPGSLGVLIPIVAIIAWGAVRVATIVSSGRASGRDPEAAARLDALEHEVGVLRQELAEAQERLDFTERLLSQQRTDRLDAPKELQRLAAAGRTVGLGGAGRRTMAWSPRARIFWPFLLTLLIADCSTKELAETYLSPGTPQDVAGSAVRFTLARNSGAAMGLSLGSYSRIGFSLVALLALIVLGQLYLRTPANASLRSGALGLIAGGAVGNLLNRLLSERGVTDFIDIGVRSWRFWTFNLADTGITIGAALLLLALWRHHRPGEGSV